MVMSKTETKYEELRRQRLEENKKRMEELHLPQLTLALKSSSPKSSLKPSPVSHLFFTFYCIHKFIQKNRKKKPPLYKN